MFSVKVTCLDKIHHYQVVWYAVVDSQGYATVTVVQQRNVLITPSDSMPVSAFTPFPLLATWSSLPSALRNAPVQDICCKRNHVECVLLTEHASKAHSCRDGCQDLSVLCD